MKREERNREINQDLDGGGKGEQRKEDAMGGEGEQRIEMKTITMGHLSFHSFPSYHTSFSDHPWRHHGGSGTSNPNLATRSASIALRRIHSGHQSPTASSCA